jgi:hypothetical protein
MLPEGFEPAIPAGERLQTLALDRSATEIGTNFSLSALILFKNCVFQKVYCEPLNSPSIRGNSIPGQLGIFVVLCGDADMNNNGGGRKRIYPSTGFRALPDFRMVENDVI